MSDNLIRRQDAPDRNVGDLISRQDAIDALKICDNNEDGINCHKCPLRDERWDGAWEDNETNCYTKLMRDSAKLLELPSAETEPKEADSGSITCMKSDNTHVRTTDDLISRQDAIIAVRLHRIDINDPKKIVRKSYEDVIRELPSAQPEHTCVNCGRTANNGGWYADGRTRCPIEEHYALPKDGFCHLWEKRNVTDDDYPERREE